MSIEGRKRVYIAGPYSGDTMSTLKNIRIGLETARELTALGYAPFCPWTDFLYLLVGGPQANPMSVADLQETSIAWLYAADCVLMLPGWKNSKGATKEHDIAVANGWPIYYDIDELLTYE